MVSHKKGRGKGLGFPTANISVSDSAEDGIYVGWVLIDGRKYASLVFIGAAITFGETDRQAEGYVLDFSEDLYGTTIGVELLRKIRDNQRFATPEALVEQMKEDEQVAREYFRTRMTRE